MTRDEAKILLNAFYNGKTSVEEERNLLSYFQTNDMDKEMLDDKLLFLELYNYHPIEIPNNLGVKIEGLIDSLEMEDLNNKDVKKTKRKLAIIFASVASIAACIAFIFFLYNENNTNRMDTNLAECNVNYVANYELKDTYSDPAEAHKAAEEALMKVSTQLNKGINQLRFAANKNERKIKKIKY